MSTRESADPRNERTELGRPFQNGAIETATKLGCCAHQKRQNNLMDSWAPLKALLFDLLPISSP